MMAHYLTATGTAPRCPVCGGVLGQVTGVTPMPVWLCVRADETHRQVYRTAWECTKGVPLGDPVNGQFGPGNMFEWNAPALVAQEQARERATLADAAADAPVTSHSKPRL